MKSVQQSLLLASTVVLLTVTVALLFNNDFTIISV